MISARRIPYYRTAFVASMEELPVAPHSYQVARVGLDYTPYRWGMGVWWPYDPWDHKNDRHEVFIPERDAPWPVSMAWES